VERGEELGRRKQVPCAVGRFVSATKASGVEIGVAEGTAIEIGLFCREVGTKEAAASLEGTRKRRKRAKTRRAPKTAPMAATVTAPTTMEGSANEKIMLKRIFLTPEQNDSGDA